MPPKPNNPPKSLKSPPPQHIEVAALATLINAEGQKKLAAAFVDNPKPLLRLEDLDDLTPFAKNLGPKMAAVPTPDDADESPPSSPLGRASDHSSSRASANSFSGLEYVSAIDHAKNTTPIDGDDEVAGSDDTRDEGLVHRQVTFGDIENTDDEDEIDEEYEAEVAEQMSIMSANILELGKSLSPHSFSF